MQRTTPNKADEVSGKRGSSVLRCRRALSSKASPRSALPAPRSARNLNRVSASNPASITVVMSSMRRVKVMPRL
ncbi:MAG: hypothetical protein IPM99_00265 [Rubrivivax sp.]|nr:hypothetical protein [Rubrivivax sp.]